MVKSMEHVLAFRPARLPVARRQIQEIHLETTSHRRTPPPSEVSALRERVTAAARAPDSDRELRRLAGTLIPRELRTVVRSIGTWEDLRGAISIVALTRPRKEYVTALWRAWQGYPTPREIVYLLAAMGQRFGMSDALDKRYAAEGAKWLEDRNPLDAIVGWTASRRIRSDELADLPASPFLADTPLVKNIFHRTLQIGSSWQLLQMSCEEVLEGWSEMSGEGLKEACANYLECVDPSLWDENREALEAIRDGYGLPGARGSRPDFWSRVVEKRRGDFREFFITRALAQAFRGDSARHQFWMELRREMLDITQGFAGDTEWSLIDFSGFSVLEFFKIGNAAYIYPEGDPILRLIRRQDEFTFPSEIKKILPGPVPGRSDNRIIHQRRWQSRARLTLQAWRERYS